MPCLTPSGNCSLSPYRGRWLSSAGPSLGRPCQAGFRTVPSGVCLLETQGRTLSWGITEGWRVGSPGPAGTALSGMLLIFLGAQRAPGTRAEKRTQPTAPVIALPRLVTQQLSMVPLSGFSQFPHPQSSPGPRSSSVLTAHGVARPPLPISPLQVMRLGDEALDKRASGCWAAAMGSRVRKPPKWVPNTAGPRTGVEGLLSFWWGSSQAPATHPLPWGNLCGSKATQKEGALSADGGWETERQR